MKRWSWIFLVGGILLVAAGFFITTRIAKAPHEGTMCTLEAKLCPDGSYVGRTGPHCEFAACPAATSTQPIEPVYHSGVGGTVLLGPTCPVEKNPPDAACAPKPYATSIAVYQGIGKTPFLIGSSNTAGVFSFTLPPGAYRLVPGGGNVLPRCESVDITVLQDKYASTTIPCDSGIR